jgi:methyl-accepting chemotaxis protein
MFVIALFVVITTVSLTKIEAQSFQIKNESFPFALLSEEMAFNVVQVQQFLTDVSATHDPDGYKDADEAAKGFMDGVAKFEAMFRKKNDSKSLQLLEDIKSDFVKYNELGKKMANVYVTQGIEAGNKIMEDFDKSSKVLTDKVHTFKMSQVKEATDLNAGMASTMAAVKLILIAIGLCALAFALVMALVITRGITTPLRNTVNVTERIAAGDLTVEIVVGARDETGHVLEAMQLMTSNLRNIISQTVLISSGIASASNQLHSTAKQMAAGADDVATQTNTVATASEEMAATSTDIARNCSIAAESCRQTAEAAAGGAKVVDQSIKGMDAIVERVRQTSTTVTALGTRSEQIGEIVSTIEDIADQTNLLALNAAIEAARAGDQGRGFAVVADEVRALAERTTKATREIGQMIKSIQSETKSAVKAMEEGVNEVEKGAELSQLSGRSLEDIQNCINDVTMQINQIATAAEEQTATTGEVTSNIQQVTGIVRQSSRGAEETASAASQLAIQAQQLQDIVGKFRT